MSAPPSIRSILAASDLTPESDEVVRAAAAIAEHTGAALHVFHVLPEPASFLGLTDDDRRAKERLERAQRELEEQVRRVLPAGAAAASVTAVQDTSHKRILDRATQVDADLVVVGREHGGGVGAHFLGTTADRVIRTAEIPCLVVRGRLDLPLRRVGVPTDFSPPARQALRLALAWSEALGAEDVEIRLVHIGWSVYQEDDPGFGERVLLPRLQQEIEETGARDRVRPVLLWANEPVERLVRYAEDANLNLLVLGTHGESGLVRALIGSIPAGVARHAPCPVLLVPPPPETIE